MLVSRNLHLLFILIHRKRSPFPYLGEGLFTLQNVHGFSKALEVDYLALAKEFDGVVNVGIVRKAKNVIIHCTRLLLCYYHVFATNSACHLERSPPEIPLTRLRFATVRLRYASLRMTRAGAVETRRANGLPFGSRGIKNSNVSQSVRFECPECAFQP